MEPIKKQRLLVAVAALGYFVDIYDLILFGIVRIPSLTDLGVPSSDMQDTGILLLNMQMAGMLIGGFLFGVLGDIKGRVTVLFGSILLYSVANISNGLVTSIPAYAFIRFLAGLGLAGELGAGITLVSETMSKEKRGYGTMLVVTFGALGAVVAALIADEFSWRMSYFVGGGLGLLLLLLRVRAMESGMFTGLPKKDQKVMSFLRIIGKRALLIKYLRCILIGTFGMWWAFWWSSRQIRRGPRGSGVVRGNQAVIWCYLGLSVGDLLTGILSQMFRSRRRVILGSLFFSAALSATYLCTFGLTDTAFYLLCFLLGTSTGYWGLFVTVASESFGTNVRSTVTTTVPNFVRGSTIPITLSFAFLQESMGWSMSQSAASVGLVCFAIAFWASWGIGETFAKDLDYLEV